MKAKKIIFILLIGYAVIKLGLLTYIMTTPQADKSAIALGIVGIILGFVLTVKASTDETDMKEALGYGLWMGIILSIYIMFWGKANDVISVFAGSIIGSFTCYSIRYLQKQ